MAAFLPAAAVEFIALSLTAAISRGRSAEYLREHRHLRPVRDEEVWLFIAQRIDLSVDFSISIEKAYKKVSVLRGSNFILSSSFSPHFSSLTVTIEDG